MDWMDKALELARVAERQGDVPVGAVIILDDRGVGTGFNRREKRQDAVSHAEIEAIREACQNLGTWRLERCQLFVTLEPCLMCMGALQQSRIASVTYGAVDAKGGALSLGYFIHEDGKTNHRFSVQLQESPECEKILKEFFRNLRAQKRK